MNSNIYLIKIYLGFVIFLLIGVWITCITLSSIYLHNEEQINYIKCYNSEKIKEYGKIHDTCNTKLFNGTHFLQVQDHVDKCYCRTKKCIQETKIQIVNNENIRFDMCYDNIDWSIFSDNCVKCFDHSSDGIALVILSIMVLPIILIIYFMICCYLPCTST